MCWALDHSSQLPILGHFIQTVNAVAEKAIGIKPAEHRNRCYYVTTVCRKYYLLAKVKDPNQFELKSIGKIRKICQKSSVGRLSMVLSKQLKKKQLTE